MNLLCRKCVTGFFVGLCISSLLLPEGSAASGEPKKIAGYRVRKTVQYGFTLQNTTPRVIKKAEFWTYTPVKQTSIQQVVKLSASHTYRLISDDLGNQILAFEFENLAPYAAKIISVRVELLMSDESNPDAPHLMGQYLTPERFVESKNEKIVNLAKSLSMATPLETARNIYGWVASHVRSEAFIPDDLGALYALEQGRGDCTEFSYLFTALSRANGIPSRAMGGYVYEGNALFHAADYHNWSEFYVGGAWHIADPQKGFFLGEQSRYVAMRIISSVVQNPLGNSHRFSYAGEGLKVIMN